MSTTAEAPVKQEPRESLFSKKNQKLLTDPINDSNPITVQVLGICSALAVTVQFKPAFIMGLSVMIVTAGSNAIISAIRNTIPSSIRIIVQLVVVAALVILVDQILKAYVYDVSKLLSVFVGLIITNCIVMGRLETYAMANKPWPSFLDGIGNGLGYTAILASLAIVRETLGSGKLTWGPDFTFYQLPQSFYDAGYVNNGLIILPPMALILVGMIIWIQRSRNKKLIEA